MAENPDYYTSIGVDIKGHINFIRQMAMMSDDMIRKTLRDEVEKNKDPVWTEIFEDAHKKKAISDMDRAAKDMKTDARLFAKKIGADSDMRNYIRKVAKKEPKVLARRVDDIDNISL
jgi:hypothetical protein